MQLTTQQQQQSMNKCVYKRSATAQRTNEGNENRKKKEKRNKMGVTQMHNLHTPQRTPRIAYVRSTHVKWMKKRMRTE